MRLAGQVTAIVPVWNGRELLTSLLRSLRLQTRSVAEIVVVDNGSTDGAADLAEREGTRVIRLGANFGFSRAVNRGIRESRGEWLAILNTDVELEPEWLERLLNATDSSDVSFATGKILNIARPATIDGTYDAICRGASSWRVGNGRPDGPAFSRARSIAFAPLTAALFRARVFEQIGPLEERFESYLEDIDLGLRCAAAGLSGVYVPEAIAYHRGSATLGKWHPDTVRRISRNQLLLVAKHYPAFLIWRFGWCIIVAQGLWGLLAMRHGAGWAFLVGKLEALRMFRQMRGNTAALRGILERSEREIHGVQRQTGFDRYWKLYFVLTGGASR